VKRLIFAFLAVGLLCSLAGCQKSIPPQPDVPSEEVASTGAMDQAGLPRPDFPLEEDVILTALEQTGLPGVISESETHSNLEGHMAYVLRDSTKTYADSDNKVLIAVISSAITKGERFLAVIFRSVPDEPATLPFVWEDWKQQIVFTTLLFGGFDDEEAVYRAFSGTETPEDEESFEWEAQLLGGYCTVSYQLNDSEVTHSFPEPIVDRAAYTVDITIYQSKLLYQKLQEEMMEEKKN